MKERIPEAIAISAAFYLLLGIVVLLDNVDSLFLESAEINIGLVHIVLVLVPFIALLYTSGELKEIRGPGGIAFLLRTEARSQIQMGISTDLEYESDVILEKGEIAIEQENVENAVDERLNEERVRELSRRIREIQPTTLLFQINRDGYYDKDAIRLHIQYMSRLSPNFRYVAFASKDGEFEGVANVSDFLYLDRAVTDDIVRSIETGSILRQHQITTSSINQESTNMEALEKMEQLDTDSLAIVNDQRKFLGVINQQSITRKLLSAAVRGET